jgi:hypothetical protein
VSNIDIVNNVTLVVIGILFLDFIYTWYRINTNKFNKFDTWLLGICIGLLIFSGFFSALVSDCVITW